MNHSFLLHSYYFPFLLSLLCTQMNIKYFIFRIVKRKQENTLCNIFGNRKVDVTNNIVHVYCTYRMLLLCEMWPGFNDYKPVYLFHRLLLLL